MLSPNLHVARCRLHRQEEERGGSSGDGEMWQEGFMRGPKQRVEAGLVQKCDVTYVRHHEAASRALRFAQVEHGCVSGYAGFCADTDEPADHAQSKMQLVRAGQRITALARTPKCGLVPEQARAIVSAVRRKLCTREHMVQEQLAWVLVTAHHSARIPGSILRSKAAPPHMRTWASSFVTVKKRSLLSLGEQLSAGTTVVAYIHAYVNLQPMPRADAAPADDEDEAADAAEGQAFLAQAERWAGPFAVLEVLQNQGSKQMVGQTVLTANTPDSGVTFSSLWVAPLQVLCMQQVVLAERDGAVELHFLDCSGKHVHERS